MFLWNTRLYSSQFFDKIQDFLMRFRLVRELLQMDLFQRNVPFYQRV